MNEPRTINNKNLYKLFINIIKYIPITLLILFIINLFLNYFGIHTIIMPCIGGMSIISLALLYLISYVFRFCYLYRLPLNYITIINVINIIIQKFNIISPINLYRFCFIFLGIFLVIYIYYWYKNRNNPKVDYISELCKRYNCDC